ncbi:N-formylglutamate amidohydrolase [Gluconacetobacter entanii]|uniref:N-formylglutamate amidohydrolase n=1 Tax=Gluconacetobacter entanii TaxID=108528 RepID=A0ABT3K7B8_9PROT|nr:N-formylglutamate amidohydrolase [Gluconacetobacter entanii]MCW4591318.1 N-formylglutamate amidohydrolase [Gluconacetobacter entanii]MCW4595560.1 N-formylglutamate amidohydrolase [Gluconacetobacter entanii]NPC90658.1 N-formylglutamate amidohydrolase [Gluconacetobacter entanii]
MPLAPLPPFEILSPTASAAPLVVASPHSGRDYTDHFLSLSRLSPAALRRSEDCFVEELLHSAPSWGAPLLHANFPRAYCDANREAWELDPSMFRGTLPDWCNTSSRKVQAGFGTIARLVGNGGPIYCRPLDFEEAERRIRTCWYPYHAALLNLIETSVAQHGLCILLDGHSMPRQGQRDSADFILGNAWGTSCAPEITATVENILTGHGYRVARNMPFAGGYVTRHYGRPRKGVHALQMEISRHLYMDEGTLERHDGFSSVQQALSRVMAELADLARHMARQT